MISDSIIRENSRIYGPEMFSLWFLGQVDNTIQKDLNFLREMGIYGELNLTYAGKKMVLFIMDLIQNTMQESQ